MRGDRSTIFHSYKISTRSWPRKPGFSTFFFPDTEALTYQTTPFCTLKDMCACETEFGQAGTFFGGPRLPRQAVSDCLSFVHAGPWNLHLHGKFRSAVPGINYWHACQILGVPGPKNLPCEAAYTLELTCDTALIKYIQKIARFGWFLWCKR